MMSNDNQNSVLLTTFYNGNKKYRVIFHKGTIVWDNEKPPPSEQRTLNIENVISVSHNYLPVSHPSQEKQIDPNHFTIHYTEQENKTWKYKRLTLRHSDPIQVSSWVKTLQNHLQQFTHRPRKLLLFVNPFGGKRNAMQIYEKYGKPLFNIAGIDVTVNVSQRKDQIRDYVLTHDLNLFDSVVCVGGDGTVSELFNGLVLKECRSVGIDFDDIDQDLPKPKIPIGIIPGGSTDTIVYCLHGTTDPTTAVLHIIFGDKLGLDLVSVYDENNLLKLYASVLSYGYLGDVAYHSDRHRWMGPSRYSYSGFKKLMLNRGYEGEVAFFSETESCDLAKCFESCEKCTSNRSQDCDKVERQWKTLKGKFFMVSGANISCACSRSPNGIAPFAHLGDGNVHLVLVRHTSIINNLKLLLRLSGKDTVLEDLPFVETYCAREFCFRSINVPSRWNCDGEIQHQVNIRAKVRCQLLTILSRGNPQRSESEKACKCCGF